jgi:hypothetical protein
MTEQILKVNYSKCNMASININETEAAEMHFFKTATEYSLID